MLSEDTLDGLDILRSYDYLYEGSRIPIHYSTEKDWFMV